MIEAVIFDMDGLLIDSEPVWREVEVGLFGELGVPLTENMGRETMGLRADEVVSYWHKRHPWNERSQEEVTHDLINRMVGEIALRDIELPGVNEALEVAERAGMLKAIASSSPSVIIDTAVNKLGIAPRLHVIQSAENEPYGKPHPGVYIATADKLGVAPENCLAIEDSPNGVIAAKAARMKCIAVPDMMMTWHPYYRIADRVLRSLTEFDDELLSGLQY